MKEMVGGCCVCSDDRGWPENPLVYCDGQSCTVAVHQACYGIVTVPTGPWYCRKCESQERSVKVKCELCPSKYGALKRTDNSGWAHVVCALYIPEVRFGNVTTMEPIQLQLIPAERFNKVCYICEENGKQSNSSVGACMQCNKSGCKQQFHVTCAQGLGLLCEEAGNYLDNVKYCGYCQHHYSKLKKGGNVKTIPPYKPVSSENHLSDSNSEKEGEGSAAAGTVKLSSQSSTTGKRKSTSSSKTSTTKTSSSSSKTISSSSQKAVHNSNSKSADKPKVTNSNSKSAKNTEDSALASGVDNSAETKTDKVNSGAKESKRDSVDIETSKPDLKESKSGKKRKANSRTPTPITVVSSENISVVISAASIIPDSSTSIVNLNEKKDSITSEGVDKPKKAKTEQPTVTTSSQPSIALITATTAKTASPSTVTTETTTATTTVTTTTTSSIIQSTSHHSLVVSVPLHSASLSPSASAINNQTSVVTSPPAYAHLPQDIDSNISVNSSNGNSVTPGPSTSQQSTTMITSELSGGGLKIAYEKQPASTLQVELERITPTEVPAKRSRSQSGDKLERPSRTKKRGANGVSSQYNSSIAAASANKRSSRSQHATPPPQAPSTSYAGLPQTQIKDSPPSSPSSESLGSAPTTRKAKGRKSAPASVSSSSSSTKESKDIKEVKDIKIFQNGVHAPHMLGNQLNPNSNMAQKMSDHLNSELEAHSIFNPNESSSNLVGPQLHHRVIASARSSSAGGSSTASGGSGLSSMLGGSGGAIPQTLDQLLERQWEQGSQFLMEQAQHFDIASLLSCLHQLRAENLRLEEHVSSLLQRRDHLLAVNARLAIPLTGPPATPQSSHPHTVNNIHPAVAASHAEVPRSRHSSSYPSHGQSTPQLPSSAPIENGLPTDSNQGYPHQHRSPATSQPQPSPNVRHSPAGTGYPNGSGMMRQSADSSGRSAQRPQPYPLYQGPGTSSTQQQMVISRREPDLHHQPSTKPS